MESASCAARKAGFSTALAGLAMAAAVCLVALAMSEPSANAAFPGKIGEIAFVSSRNGNAEIYVMNADGTGASIRLTETDPQTLNTKPDWGPFRYDFDGFHEPVNNLPTTNAVKAGSAVPVKFGLSGDQGLSIFATDYPKSQQIDCDSAVSVDVLEQTATAGDAGLSYDAATGQYTYVWKTGKSWAGTCRQLLLKLDDSSVHRANFTFK